MAEFLPIMQCREEIIEAVRNNRVVIIKAETGAGKSTQVPQFLLECSPKVIVTQPRRLAATSIAQRIAEEMQCEVGGVVGYHTSLDRKDSEETRILLCTDGLQLLQQLLGKEIPEGILVIDEIHEWNLNIELLVAWTRLLLKRGAVHKLVVMSATIEEELIASYFGEAAIVKVPGRTFPVTERKAEKTIVQETAELLRKGRNVLVFQPGKVEITRTIQELVKLEVDADVLPLHAEMPLIDQVPCFITYRRPKCIVATNVAQTSITIPDIDAVVDSGMERRLEYIDGVEGLYIRPISLADREQRKGRAGRTKPGVYVDTCASEVTARSIFPQADIIRLPMDGIILQLALMGIDVEELRFFHQPKPEHIAAARQSLYRLGCVDRFGTLTPIGKRVAPLPVPPRFGRMLVEAMDCKVLADMITLVAIVMEGGITNNKNMGWMGKSQMPMWSDAFAQLAAYEVALGMQPEELERNGIDPKSFAEVRHARYQLRTRLRQFMEIKRSRGGYEGIVRAIYAGLADCLYKKSLVKGYKDKAGNTRDLPVGSVVGDEKYVMGIPWNLQVMTGFGPKTLRLITMATRVDLKLLAKVAPHLITVQEEESSETGALRPRVVRTYCDGLLIAEEIIRNSS